jgi:hypothetical protein
MAMPGRAFSSGSSYRYGFNGQEKSNELNDNFYTAEYWEYDARIGRRWNIDPVKKFWQSGYSTFSNNPIWFIDKNGDTDTLPRNPYAGIDLSKMPDPLSHHQLYKLIKRPTNAPVDRNTTFFTDLPYYWSGGDELYIQHAPISKLGTYTTNPGFSPFNMKSTPSGVKWNEFTESNNYFLFTGTFKGSEKGFVNFMLGHYINGTGPINYVFSLNGEVSNFMKGSQIVKDAISAWEEAGSKDGWNAKIDFGFSAQKKLIKEDRVISAENFVGSANITINVTNSNQILLRIYNVTSITSGDLSKHMPGGQWMPSVVANPNSNQAQPYSNILQIFQLQGTKEDLQKR